MKTEEQVRKQLECYKELILNRDICEPHSHTQDRLISYVEALLWVLDEDKRDSRDYQ